MFKIKVELKTGEKIFINNVLNYEVLVKQGLLKIEHVRQNDISPKYMYFSMDRVLYVGDVVFIDNNVEVIPYVPEVY